MTDETLRPPAPPSPAFDRRYVKPPSDQVDQQWQQTGFALPFVLAGVLGIANMLGLIIVFSSDTYRAENIMGQLLNAASRTNGLLTLAVIDLVVIGVVMMIRR